MDLIEYLKSINQTKVNLMRTYGDPKAVSDYPAFVTRRLLSYHLDAVMLANEVSTLPLDPQMEYEYFLHGLPKARRFAKMEKKSIVSEDVDLLKRFYNYSTARAEEILPLHTEADLEQIRKRISKGGIVAQEKKRTSSKTR